MTEPSCRPCRWAATHPCMPRCWRSTPATRTPSESAASRRSCSARMVGSRPRPTPSARPLSPPRAESVASPRYPTGCGARCSGSCRTGCSMTHARVDALPPRLDDRLLRRRGQLRRKPRKGTATAPARDGRDGGRPMTGSSTGARAGVRVVLTVTMMAWDGAGYARMRTLLTSRRTRARLVTRSSTRSEARRGWGEPRLREVPADSGPVHLVRPAGQGGPQERRRGSYLTVCTTGGAATWATGTTWPRSSQVGPRTTSS